MLPFEVYHFHNNETCIMIVARGTRPFTTDPAHSFVARYMIELLCVREKINRDTLDQQIHA